jgi:anti-anti-sigma regulatory factor
MSFGFIDIQLWLKNSVAIQIYVLLKWVRIVIRLSNVALVDCSGVRSLTEEEQLYIRLRRLGKYFSTGEEICMFC